MKRDSMTLFVTMTALGAAGAPCSADPVQLSRYSFEATCYFVETNSLKYTVHLLGGAVGLSDYSCKNAYDNLVMDCNTKARAAGFAGGSVYKDILIATKASTLNDTRTTVDATESSSAGFELIRRSGLVYHSVTDSRTEIAKTEATYIRVDKKSDCDFDANVPQQKVPSVQGSSFGG